MPIMPLPPYAPTGHLGHYGHKGVRALWALEEGVQSCKGEAHDPSCAWHKKEGEKKKALHGNPLGYNIRLFPLFFL